MRTLDMTRPPFDNNVQVVVSSELVNKFLDVDNEDLQCRKLIQEGWNYTKLGPRGESLELETQLEAANEVRRTFFLHIRRYPIRNVNFVVRTTPESIFRLFRACNTLINGWRVVTDQPNFGTGVSLEIIECLQVLMALFKHRMVFDELGGMQEEHA